MITKREESDASLRREGLCSPAWTGPWQVCPALALPGSGVTGTAMPLAAVDSACGAFLRPRAGMRAGGVMERAN